MANSNYHNKRYSLLDIRRYIRGELSHAEAHALEKAALDDPLLAEAIEGLLSHPENEYASRMETDLNELSDRLQQRIGQKKRQTPLLFLRGWRVAAALLILLLGGWMAYLAWGPATEKQELAIRQTDQPKPEASPVQPMPASDTPPSQSELPAKAEEKTQETTASAGQQEVRTPLYRSVPAGADKNEKPADTLREEYVSPLNTRVASASDKPVSAPLPAARKKSESAEPGWIVVGDAEKKMDRRADSSITRKDQFGFLKGKTTAEPGRQTHYFQGQVVDDKNLPVANALVLTNNRQTALVTDEKGKFNVVSSDSSLDADISRTGYLPLKVRLQKSQANNRYVLRPDSSLSLAGNFTAGDRFSQALEKSLTLNRNAEPENGWPAYYDYIRQNKISLPNEIQGQVLVSFLLNRNGSINLLQVDESLSPEQDAEALRLVQEGPAWKLLNKRRSARVVLAIPF